MAAFPKNYLSVPKHARKVIEFFAGRLDAPCYIVGNGPSVSEVCLSDIELQNSTVFRANWFFLEEEKRFGDRVDGFFWSVENKGLREAIEDIQARNERSEEHTSELQSLMRISYAVFCLKKKTTTID